MRARLEAAARSVPGVQGVRVNLTTKVVAHAVQRGVQLLPGVKNIVAVASGKGGVGKEHHGGQPGAGTGGRGCTGGPAGCRFYGPSQPMMMGIDRKPESLDGKTMEPLVNHGVQVMSIGFLVNQDEAMIWRGPMATQALEQLLRQTNWKDLDYLIVDMPPGTGDIQLTLSQRVPMTGAVIVTTPQDIALLDARKGIKMFEKVGCPSWASSRTWRCMCARTAATPNTSLVKAAGAGWRRTTAWTTWAHCRSTSGSACRPTVASPPWWPTLRVKWRRSTPRLRARMAAKIAQQSKDFSSKFPTISVSKST